MLDLFSPLENAVLKALGKRKMRIEDITTRVYIFGDVNTIPMDPSNNIAQAIRRINKKCEYHKLPWFLNGAGTGRGGREVWRDKR